MKIWLLLLALLFGLVLSQENGQPQEAKGEKGEEGNNSDPLPEAPTMIPEEEETLSHHDQTAISIFETFEKGQKLVVQVDRYEKDAGQREVIWARLIEVKLQFDVSPETRQVYLNGQPLPLGFSELIIESKATTEQHPSGSPSDQLIPVKVFAFVGLTPVTLETGEKADQIVIQERVMGLQPHERWQSRAVEQVLLVHADGTLEHIDATYVHVLEGEPSRTGEHSEQGHQHHHPHHSHESLGQDETSSHPSSSSSSSSSSFKNQVESARRWFHSLPFVLRVLVAFFGGVICGTIAYCILKAIKEFFCRCCLGNSRRDEEECKEVWRSRLKAYTIHYTALPQEDLELKKSKEWESELEHKV